MNLVIDISALDKTQAAVTSITNVTPVTSIQNLTLGDTEPLNITFTDSSQTPPAPPSWAGAGGYVPVVGLGTLDANALLNYTSTTAFTAVTAGWTGYLALDTYNLTQAVIMGVTTGGGLANIATDPRTRNQRPQWVYLWLQIQVIDPNGNAKTYALLRVAVMNRTLPASAQNTTAETEAIYAWLQANGIFGPRLFGYNAQTNNAGTSTVQPGQTRPIHTEVITFGGSAGTRPIVLSTVGRMQGDLVIVRCNLPATSGIALDFRNAATGGTQLYTITTDSSGNAIVFVSYFDGAAWNSLIQLAA